MSEEKKPKKIPITDFEEIPKETWARNVSFQCPDSTRKILDALVATSGTDDRSRLPLGQVILRLIHAGLKQVDLNVGTVTPLKLVKRRKSDDVNGGPD